MIAAATLSAFHLELPGIVSSSVELLGSWDNFSIPYSLQRDTARGPGHWRGCFTFDRIIYDGLASGWNTPRSGALLQGGRYWYYYRVDDRDECYDPTKPSTYDCPLLPGQCVNLLELPFELALSTHSSASASIRLSRAECRMTLDPDERYKTPRKVKSTLFSRPRSLLNLFRPRTSHQASAVTKIENQQIDVYSVKWPLQDPSSATSCMSPAIDKPIQDVALEVQPRHVRAKPSLKRMAPGIFKTRWNRNQVSEDDLPPAMPQELQTSPAKDSFISSKQVSPIKQRFMPEPQPTNQIRQSASVRNFARVLSGKPSKSPLLGRRSKSHAVLNSQQQETTRTPRPEPQQKKQTIVVESVPSPAAESEICSPTFSSDTISDSGSRTPNRFSAQYGISNAEPFDLSKMNDAFDELDHITGGLECRNEHTHKAWRTELGPEKDDFYPVHNNDDINSTDADDNDDEQTVRERLVAIEALRSTLMANDALVTANESCFGDLAFLRTAIL